LTPRPAAVVAAQRRDDAEGALVVAPFGDLDVGVVPRRRQKPRRLRVVDVGWQVPGFGTRDSGLDRFAVRTQKRNRPSPGPRVPSPQPRAPGPDCIHDLRHFTGPQHRVNLRNLRHQLATVTLSHATGDDEPLALAGLLQLGHLEDGVNRFLLGLVDERAGIDDEDVGILRIAGQLMARLLGEPEHDLGVDEVLRAAEGDHSNLHCGDLRILDG
jgi:hypothetical protein